MTPEELAIAAGELIERPDFVIDEPEVRNLVRMAISSCHGLANFSRDLVPADTPVPLGDSSIAITKQPRQRSLAAIEILDTQGEVMPDLIFHPKSVGRRAQDYYGYVYRNTYFRAGSTLTLNFLPFNSVVTARVWSYTYPTFELDPLTELWTTDSWIAREYPMVVVVTIARLLGALTSENDTIRNYTQHAAEQQRRLLADEEIDEANDDQRS